MRKFIREHKSIWLVLFVPLYLVCFFLLENWIKTDYWVSYMPLDDAIPFVEQFVVFYYLWVPSMVFIGLYQLLHDEKAFVRYMSFLVAGFSLSLLICALFPNGQDLRPRSFPRQNLFTALVGLIYRADTNTNVFPSMHVVGCIAVVASAFDAGWKHPATMRTGFVLLALLIAASTVFIKQHSFLDVIGGAVLCVPLWFAIYGKKCIMGTRGGKTHAEREDRTSAEARAAAGAHPEE